MAYDKLVLHPLNPRAILHDPLLLMDALRSRGLIGGSFGCDGEVHYAPGPRFRELVRFRPPAEPRRGELHVSLSETSEEPAFLGATYAQPPLCRSCRGLFHDWRAQLASWRREMHRQRWTCPRCGRATEVRELDWGHTGGIARYSLDLWGVRRNEADPSAELLEVLKAVTLETWEYFYYRLSTGPTPPARSRAQLS
jgi:hypothetical protein